MRAPSATTRNNEHFINSSGFEMRRACSGLVSILQRSTVMLQLRLRRKPPEALLVMKSIPKFYEYFPWTIPVKATERDAVVDQIAAIGKVERGYRSRESLPEILA